MEEKIKAIEYVKSTLFIYSEEGEMHREFIKNNPYGVEVSTLPLIDFKKNPTEDLKDVDHVVVAADLSEIKEIIKYSFEFGFSLGLLLLPKQRYFEKSYGIPKKIDEMLALALQKNENAVDVVFCNDELLLFKGIVGQVPFVDSVVGASRMKIVWSALKQLSSLKLFTTKLETTGENKNSVTTAVSGCLILEAQEQLFASGMIDHDNSCNDGMVSSVLLAPVSVVDYFKLLWFRIIPGVKSQTLPKSVGYIKSSELTITPEITQKVTVDGDATLSTPIHLKVKKGILRLNNGLSDEQMQKGASSANEKFSVAHLPIGKEVVKAKGKRIPFFTYASEERFKDLFTALRADAKLDSIYITLMVLSTILATVGLYLNSASVVIGAMLLAPLMAPIISLAMSLLRMDRLMFKQSAWKIGVGVFLALLTSAFFTFLSPYQPLTGEMQGRLSPTVLDLTVAIVAGIAGAYTKSFKEILQSLAGVSIAVALVPPLAVAGIGLGRLDPTFFGQAFLLFSTNLIGIILAATITFRLLGFSAAVKDKKGVAVVIVFLILISIPLVMTFQGIVERARYEKKWSYERFLVNGKYLIVRDANLNTIRGEKVLTVHVLTRDHLTRVDLNELKRKVKQNIPGDFFIRAELSYIP